MKNSEKEIEAVNPELEATVIAIEEKEIEAVVVEKNTKFLNPFDAGVSYVEFQKALGKKSVAEYCKGKLTTEQISWLENELSIIKK